MSKFVYGKDQFSRCDDDWQRKAVEADSVFSLEITPFCIGSRNFQAKTMTNTDKLTLRPWQYDTMTMGLAMGSMTSLTFRQNDTLIKCLYFGYETTHWYYDTLKMYLTPWHYDNATMWHCDTMTLWQCDNLTLWQCDYLTLWQCDKDLFSRWRWRRIANAAHSVFNRHANYATTKSNQIKNVPWEVLIAFFKYQIH